ALPPWRRLQAPACTRGDEPDLRDEPGRVNTARQPSDGPFDADAVDGHTCEPLLDLEIACPVGDDPHCPGSRRLDLTVPGDGEGASAHEDLDLEGSLSPIGRALLHLGQIEADLQPRPVAGD